MVSKILNKYDDAEKRVVRPVEKDKVTRSTGKVINTVSEDVLLETNDTKFE